MNGSNSTKKKKKSRKTRKRRNNNDRKSEIFWASRKPQGGFLMAEKACRNCNRIVEDASECPVCKNNDLSDSWNGLVVIYDP
ncbi:MAG: transcription elongation factor subunit Spt4, partial [Candidatus Nanohalobium sp.]